MVLTLLFLYFILSVSNKLQETVHFVAVEARLIDNFTDGPASKQFGYGYQRLFQIVLL